MNDHPHSHDEPRPQPPAPETPVDTGSQALAEALHSSFKIVRILMLVLVVVFVCSGFFQVKEGEQAIILRFGKPVGEGEKMLRGPGWHFSFPAPIDEVVRLSVKRTQSAESRVGWYAVTPEQELAGTEPWAGPSLNPAIDGYLLTSDGNIIHARARLFYRIEDPLRYVFAFTNAADVVQYSLDNAMVSVAASYKVDDILTRDKFGFQEAVQRRVTELLDRHNAGVSVERCDITHAVPPRQPQVRDAFLNVLNAEINRNKLLSDAYTYTNQVLSRAGAQVAALTNAAETARLQLISDLSSRATNFSKLLPFYQTNRNLFIQQQLAETMGRALTNVQEKWYVPERADGKPRELRLLLNRETPKPANTQTNR